MQIQGVLLHVLIVGKNDRQILRISFDRKPFHYEIKDHGPVGNRIVNQHS